MIGDEASSPLFVYLQDLLISLIERKIKISKFFQPHFEFNPGSNNSMREPGFNLAYRIIQNILALMRIAKWIHFLSHQLTFVRGGPWFFLLLCIAIIIEKACRLSERMADLFLGRDYKALLLFLANRPSE